MKDVDDQTLLTLALIENLQRDDLSPIDEAAGYQRLAAEFKLPHGEIARLVGRNRATVANLLRLLQLPADVQALVHERKLSEGHARALLGLAEPEAMIALARQAVDAGLVGPRDGGAGTGRGAVAAPPPRAGAPRRARPAARDRRPPTCGGSRTRCASIWARMCASPPAAAAAGFLTVSYYSNDDLARVLELILGRPFQG